MTISQMRQEQRIAEKARKNKGLELRTQLALAKDIALWEQAIQLATLNETVKRLLSAFRGRRGVRK